MNRRLPAKTVFVAVAAAAVAAVAASRCSNQTPQTQIVGNLWADFSHFRRESGKGVKGGPAAFIEKHALEVKNLDV